jgi:hypothetical protein
MSGAYLLNTSLNYVPRYKNRFPLVHAYCSGDCLVLYAWVPLWFDDEDAICCREVETVLTLAIILKVYLLPLRDYGLVRPTYPNAPVPVVMMRTGIAEEVENSSRIFCRRPRGLSPSIRWNGIFSALRYLSMRFRVLVQHENIILLREGESALYQILPDYYLPFGLPQVLLNI